MSTALSDNLLYQQLATKIGADIVRSGLQPGERFDSIQALSKRFQVSGATAVRAVDLLKERGVLMSIPKKGTFVSGIPEQEPPAPAISPLRTVITVNNTPVKANGFVDRISTSVFSTCQELGLSFRLEILNDAVGAPVTRLPFTPQAGDGILVMSAMLPGVTFNLLRTPHLPRVVVDGIVPFSPCVLSDNASGMQQLLEHLHGLGHRRVMLGDVTTIHPNATNENQRRQAFLRVAAELGMAAEVVAVDTVEQLVARLRRPQRPTAAMFMQDDPAIRFVRAAEAAGFSVPGDISVTGFDNCPHTEGNAEHLTTVSVDLSGLGRTAVQVLLDFDEVADRQNRWHSVPCQLAVGPSTGSASKGAR